MSNLQHIHATFLALQLASVFKQVNDLGFHRSVFNQFDVLNSNAGSVVVVGYIEGLKKGRTHVDATVTTEQNGFRFRQHYNYGILLELEVSYVGESGEYVSLLESLLNVADSSQPLTELMIDFEYAISIFTEHVASNLAKL